MPPTGIRDATPADARAIARIHVEGWRAAYRGVLTQERLEGLSVDGREQEWRELLEEQDEATPVLAAEAGEALTGVIVLRIPGRDEDLGAEAAEITLLYVEPGLIRQGHGAALIAAGLQRAASRGCNQAAVWTFEATPAAVAFYEAMGFERDGAERTVPSRGPTEIRLRRGLAPG